MIGKYKTITAERDKKIKDIKWLEEHLDKFMELSGHPKGPNDTESVEKALDYFTEYIDKADILTTERDKYKTALNIISENRLYCSDIKCYQCDFNCASSQCLEEHRQQKIKIAKQALGGNN